jgi:hypothetical protein
VKGSLRDEPAHVSLRPERVRTATSTQGAQLLGPSGGIHKPPYAKVNKTACGTLGRRPAHMEQRRGAYLRRGGAVALVGRKGLL